MAQTEYKEIFSALAETKFQFSAHKYNNIYLTTKKVDFAW